MRVVFIHPENHTYPLFSLELKSLKMYYDKKCDHDKIRILVENLQLYDLTNYP